MRTIHIIAGITTLAHYRDKTDGFDIGADIDEIHARATDKPLSEANVAKMLALGWFQRNGADADNPDAAYDPTEGWTCYV